MPDPQFLGRTLGPDELFVIAGPCVIENESMALSIAEKLTEITHSVGVSLIFKASYTKANRSSVGSFTGPGMEEGLAILAKIKETHGIPVLTDIHGPAEAPPVAEVCDALQIPAFLSRQTELLQAAAATGRVVNVKKGQFLAPEDMTQVVEKLRAVKPDGEVWLTERGATFGYHNLVVDMRTFPILREQNASVVYDVTHSLQHPGVGGDRRFALPLARAAVAAGAHGLFFETHPDPAHALSDATTQLPLEGIYSFLDEMVEWKRLQSRWAERPDTIGSIR
ncbi:MAG: 3-deoxy-8-phosphooctulonate synthase [Candidatus Eisenbacteria bacterium]